MFINIEIRKKLCRLGKRMILSAKTKKEGEWLVKFFKPQKPGRPKTIMTTLTKGMK